MTCQTPNFILAGAVCVLSSWPKRARENGILLCRGDPTRCVKCNKNGCGILSKSIALDVFPAVSVSGFDGEEFEGMLFVDSSKTRRCGICQGPRTTVCCQLRL